MQQHVSSVCPQNYQVVAPWEGVYFSFFQIHNFTTSFSSTLTAVFLDDVKCHKNEYT